MHPLLHLIATQPNLLAEHAEAYAELLGEDLGVASVSLKRRIALNAVALCAFGVAVMLGGVALMLWAVIPASNIEAPWALIVAPLLPLLGAVGCLVAARQDPGTSAFDNMKRQVRADMAMLREVSAS